MDITIEHLTSEQASAALGELAALLRDAVEGGASIGFLLPLADAAARDYWAQVIGEVAQGARLLLVARRGGRVVGTVQLALAAKQNALHRAEVQKLIVERRSRGQGVGGALMAAVEQAARAAGRSLLVLDTRRGDPAERLYERCGYVRAGVVPHYARSPEGQLEDATFFYRQLERGDR